jgi:hypothetical protein
VLKIGPKLRISISLCRKIKPVLLGRECSKLLEGNQMDYRRPRLPVATAWYCASKTQVNIKKNPKICL